MGKDGSAFARHGERKFPTAGLLASSAGRGWNAIAAEIRSHRAGEIPDIRSDHLEITIALAGDRGATVTRSGDGALQETAVAPGVIWLCPPGVHESAIRISGDLQRILHLYMPASRFNEIERHAGRGANAGSIRYAAGLDDRALAGMAGALQAELEHETSGGRLMADCLSLALATRLSSVYAGHDGASLGSVPAGLDSRRLRRVLEFVEAHIEDTLTIDALADVACLSPFHFARAFRLATGAPPHRYLAARRMSLAKTLLADPTQSVEAIASRSGFSSASNFGRAFKRATGATPAAYRAKL